MQAGTIIFASSYSYQEFSGPLVQFRLNRWLYALCWTGTDRPGVLFDRATAWLVTHKVVLPGVTVLERHVARLRSRVHDRIWFTLCRGLIPEAKDKLETLLTVPTDGHQSLLDRLRKGPFRRSAPELVRALRRIEDVRALGIDRTIAQRVPPGRIQALARMAMTAKASALQRLPQDRRLATLVAFAITLEAVALDYALDLLDILITEIFTDATKADEQARLRSLKDLDAAAVQLGQACQLVLDADVADTTLQQTIFQTVSREHLAAAIQQVTRLIQPPEDTYYRELQQHWRRVRRFLPTVLQTIRFGFTPAGRPIAKALEDLTSPQSRSKQRPLRLDVVPQGWRKYVIRENGVIDEKAYTFCCLDRVRAALRRRDLFVTPSLRYTDVRSGLLSGTAWDAARSTVCRSLGHSLSAEETISALSRQLDATYRTVAAKLSSNPAARIETRDGKEQLVLSGLEKLEEPDSLVRLREAVKARLPRVDLPEILLEIAARTGFATKFTHVSERASRVEDLGILQE